MEFRRDGYCGLYCGACPNLLATEHDTLDALADIRRSKPEDQICFGCKSGKTAPFCTTCRIKQCARDKGFEFCFECDSFPCDILTAFIEDNQYPYHLGVTKNLSAIHEDGVKAWLEYQESRWRCSACGAKFAWQDETCSTCGKPVSNYKAEL